MNRVNFVAIAAVALALSACSGVPAWNASVFPEQPEYAMSGAEQPTHIALVNAVGE